MRKRGVGPCAEPACGQNRDGGATYVWLCHACGKAFCATHYRAHQAKQRGEARHVSLVERQARADRAKLAAWNANAAK